jgi:fatty-acyl-CoA synthase
VLVLGAAESTGGFAAVPPGTVERSGADGKPEAPQTAPADLAYILYTSGTSAEPKGCMTSHDAVTRQAFGVALTRYLLQPGDAFWCPLPLVHTGGLTTLMACLAAGADYIHAGRFDPEVAIDQLERNRCTHAIPAFETIWLRVIDHPRFASADLSALRVVLNAGTPERLRQLQERVPQAAQLSTFGATEGGGHISMSLPADPLELRVTTGGHPLPGMEARAIDPGTGEDRPAGQVGEVLYRGAMRFVGYYKNPELDAQTIDADGWFHTGDLGTVDADGRLTFRGRLKDMLKVGGENVAAPEVEAYLLTHPAVNIAAVVGVADARYTEVPAAFVELVPGAACSEKEIIGFCLGRISTFKVPRYVRFVDEWPMSGIKIRKFVLREQLERELAGAGITEAPIPRA